MLSLSQPDLIGTAWVISTFTFAILWVTFIVLYALEWRQRIREEHEHDTEMAEIITDYEHRLVGVEKQVSNNGEWIELLIQRNHLISVS